MLTSQFSCTPKPTINFNDPHIRYTGRIGLKDDAAELSWTASSAIINFKGTGVTAVLNDTKGYDLLTIVVDGKVVNTIQPKRGKYKNYQLISALPDTIHRLELFKRTEAENGTLLLRGFSIEGSGTLLPPPTFKHRIEFYGNSITCGFSLEDPEGKDRGDYGYENGFLSYANLTARHFDAEYYCIAKSGIGVTVSWSPNIMPELYARVNVDDTTRLWDFNKYTPELVVVNLFQNDYHLVDLKDHKEFKHRFGSTPPKPDFLIAKYKEFIQTIRSKYPNTKIICAMGSMDSVEPGSPFPGYVEKAVAELKDKNIYTLFFPYLGAHRHPNAGEHRVMAKQLIDFIHEKFGW
ncbi:SGNH/GDSL hydrolase family protein [Mucilaginibacter terrenus]|uniref:SGNH/GDSL hydrolase family protein n=1 Tax=Mucilaginibacter terrenus TaxID=2482727 RepID=UPI0014021955|nr:SGNH/GDSL hydrolase family protein [Mucilaginibacter terrenus]